MIIGRLAENIVNRPFPVIGTIKAIAAPQNIKAKVLIPSLRAKIKVID